MTPSPAQPSIEDSCQESLSDKNFEAFFDCVLLGGLDFFLGGFAVYYLEAVCEVVWEDEVRGPVLIDFDGFPTV